MTEKEQKAISYLEKDFLLHVCIIEPIRRGTAEILAVDSRGVLLKETGSGAHMLSAGDPQTAGKFLARVPSAELFVVCQAFAVPIVREKYRLARVMECYQAAYLEKSPLPIREDIPIRPLGLEWKDFITAHYHTVDDSSYIENLLDNEMIFGAFWNGELAGFIGTHDEGTMGLLEVLPEYRRKGIGLALESFMINRTLAKGWTPFGQIVAGNDRSIFLQRRLGMQVSEKTLFWLS